MKKNIESHPVEKMSWYEMEMCVKILMQNIKDGKGGSFIGVLAIPSGGYIPAVLVSRQIGLHGQVKPVEDALMRDGKYLIVDEIADSGKTMKTVSDRFPNSHYAALVTTTRAKSLMGNKPFHYGQIIDHTWVQFPWELSGEERI